MYRRITHPVLLALLLAGAPSCKHDSGGAAAGSTSADGSTVVAAASGSVPGTDTNGAAMGATGPSFEGAITMHITDGKRPPQDITMLTKANKVRVDIPEKNGETAHSVFDPSTGKALVIMDSRKMAMLMTIPAASAAGAQGLPPHVTKTGKHETIAGRDCEDWDVVEAVGSKHEQLCVAEGMVFFDFSALAPPGSTGASMGTWLSQLRDKREFPMRALTLDPAGKEMSRMEVTKIDTKPIDDSMFTVPAGYKQMDMSKMGDLAGGLHPPIHPR